jgi:Fe-Mn family superoxide dismutase
MANLYSLPPLPYGYKDLAPVMSEEQLTIHHTKHHNTYVTATNATLEKLDKARKEGSDYDIKATLKDFSWNNAGRMLHDIFWVTLGPAGKGGTAPEGALGAAINAEFGSFERFKKEFTTCATSVEGSGWAALVYCRGLKRPLLMQIEKHNVNVIPQMGIVMVFDVFEHAYYLDYKNDRAKYVNNLWTIVNWSAVGARFDNIAK